MRILFLTFYYPPDLCAGSFRAGPLVEALSARLGPTDVLDVVTTQPNRYASFRASAPQTEQQGLLHISRVELPRHASGFIDQAWAFTAYARHVWSEIHDKKYDLVIGTSSRLMTAWLAARVARHCEAKLYLDIRDIFADTMGDVLRSRLAPVVEKVFGLLERDAINRAALVNLVSPGFESYFCQRYPKQKWTFHTNGIDSEFLGRPPNEVVTPGNGKKRILYAGNVGEGQGLEKILPDLAELLRDVAEFIVIGDGGRRHALAQALAEKRVENVTLLGPVAREDLIQAYENADVLFVHLNDYEAFRRVLPSKLFEYGAFGKPILAGLAGYAADFVESELDNAAVFDPCDASAALRAFNALSMQPTERAGFIDKYKRDSIAARMAQDIVELARN